MSFVSKMRLPERLQYVKLILGSYALFIVVAASFVRFTVTVTETIQIEDILDKARQDFVLSLLNKTENITCDAIEKKVDLMHQKIMISLIFPIKTKTQIGISESIQFAWNIFTTMGDPRLDDSKLFQTFLFGGFGIFLYLFNLLGWVIWLIEKIHKCFEKENFEKVTVKDEEQNSFLFHYRRNLMKREKIMNGRNDDIINDEMAVEQKYHWHEDPYYDYNNRTEISFQRALANHNIYERPFLGHLFIPCVILFSFILGVTFDLVYEYENGMDAVHAGFASALTLDAPKRPTNHWWNPFIVIPLSTIANLFFFATIYSFAQQFFVFMAKNYYQYGIKL